MEMDVDWWDWLRSLPDRLPDDWRPYWPVIAAAAGLVVLLILYAVLERLLLRPFFRRRRPAETEAHLREEFRLATLGHSEDPRLSPRRGKAELRSSFGVQ